MLTDQDRQDYLAHLNRLLGELSILLDAYPLSEDRPVLQTAFDAIRPICERVFRGVAREEPKPLIERLAALERQSDAQGYRMHIEDGLVDLIPSRRAEAGEVHSFRFNDAGIQAALEWLEQRASQFLFPVQREERKMRRRADQADN